MALPVLAGLLMFGIGVSSQADAQGSSDDAARVTAGKAVYETSCAGCHGADGTGVAGLGRPLIGVADQSDRATHITSISEGKGTMPAFGDKLSAEEIEDAASYVRLTFVEAEEEEPEEAEEAEEAEPEEDDAADAASSDGETELALTGIDSGGLAVVGVAMVAVGAGLVHVSRRRS